VIDEGKPFARNGHEGIVTRMSTDNGSFSHYNDAAMGIARNVLLWGSRSQKLREMLPRYRFVRNSVSRFMPGEQSSDALDATEVLNGKGMPTVLTHLGENVQSRVETEEVRDHYLDLLSQIQSRGLKSQISVKLTELGLDQDDELCRANLVALIEQAAALNNFVWVDMEGSAYTNATLKLFQSVRSGHSNTGLCVQAYLYRTADDLGPLLRLKSHIRLVKGAYAEPSNIAYSNKADTDENFYQLACRLLEEVKKNGGSPPGIATHDVRLIQRIVREAGAMGLPPDAFEIQMLYGIRAETQQQLVRDGFHVRVLISYGAYWFPWYMRRLAERPANVSFVLRNMLRG
jgi:proline dehydrogenase